MPSVRSQSILCRTGEEVTEKNAARLEAGPQAGGESSDDAGDAHVRPDGGGRNAVQGAGGHQGLQQST